MRQSPAVALKPGLPPDRGSSLKRHKLYSALKYCECRKVNRDQYKKTTLSAYTSLHPCPPDAEGSSLSESDVNGTKS